MRSRSTAPTSTLQDELLGFIATLEADGRDDFNCYRPDEADRQFCEAHPYIKSGARFDMSGVGRVWWNHAPVVAFDADDLVVVAETRAALPDNCAKLAKSGLDERHLFVWVNVWEIAAAAAFAQGLPPPRPPLLPEEVTDLWIGRLTERAIQVWHFARER